MNFLHIVGGWYKSKIHADKESVELSRERLKVCVVCPHAIEKKILKIINGKAVDEKTKACEYCGCPIFEKSLVTEEKCELKKWKK